MPGHKRNCAMLEQSLPYDADITEINGFDDLHDAQGILKAACEKAQRVFHGERSYMLINGSTCGILAAISSAVCRGDCIIAARNCHKAVYNACALSELDVRFVYPTMDKSGVCGSISPQSVSAALLDCPKAKAVVITSPTYEGVVSDVASIAEICHSRGVLLIVDNAHGAHQRFCTFGRKGEPVSCGADIVISSLHKTLPSLTQTAVAHINGSLADREKFERYLGVFETSSPSYILMASMDACFDFLEKSEKAFSEYEKSLLDFSEKMKKLKRLTVLCHGKDSCEQHGFYAFDKGKLVIVTSGSDISGVELTERLRGEYSLELEMAYPTYALAMTSVCDTRQGLDRLADALLQIDKTLAAAKKQTPFPPLPKPMRIRMTNAELERLPDLELTRELAASGRYISRRCIYAYPPGVPIVTPGELIGSFEYDYIELLKNSGVKIKTV